MYGGDLIGEMAVAIWAAVGGRGGPPRAATLAAADLGDLYEAMNGAPLSQLSRRFPDGLSGQDLAEFAMTPGRPFVSQIKVPGFTVTLQNDELEWEGGDRDIRNPAHATVPTRNGGELWVLLIEDEPSKQVSTTRMIKKLYPTAQVIVSDNGPAAIANLETHDVKLVISDVDILGEMSGVDVFKWVRANQPHLVDKYVFFTGNDTGEMYEGVTPIHYRILQKPAGVKDLGEAIRAPGPQEDRRPTTIATPVTPRSQGDDAASVARAAQTVMKKLGPEGRLTAGSEKVWIAAAYRAAVDQGLISMSLPEFKRALIAANRQGLVNLARQDLRDKKDQDIALESEIVDLGSSFNFLIDPAGSAW